MSTETHAYRHSLTGKVQVLTEDAASVFPEYLQRVADDAKPYEPGLFKPGKVGEFENPEPLTDSELAAQQVLDEVLEDNSPRSAAARQAKADLKAAQDAAAVPVDDNAPGEPAANPEGVSE